MDIVNRININYEIVDYRLTSFSHIRPAQGQEYHYHKLDSLRQGFAPSGSSLPAHRACESD